MNSKDQDEIIERLKGQAAVFITPKEVVCLPTMRLSSTPTPV